MKCPKHRKCVNRRGHDGPCYDRKGHVVPRKSLVKVTEVISRDEHGTPAEIREYEI